jgi:hypothetical protein
MAWHSRASLHGLTLSRGGVGRSRLCVLSPRSRDAPLITLITRIGRSGHRASTRPDSEMDGGDVESLALWS